MNDKIDGFFNDDGMPVNPKLVPKPSLRVSCRHDCRGKIMEVKAKKIRVNKNFSPCPVSDEDEVYRNGIFEFNITKMIEYIHMKVITRT